MDAMTMIVGAINSVGLVGLAVKAAFDVSTGRALEQERRQTGTAIELLRAELTFDAEVRRQVANKRVAIILKILNATDVVVREFMNADPHMFESGILVRQLHAWARHQLPAEAFCGGETMEALVRFQATLIRSHAALTECQMYGLREEASPGPAEIQKVMDAERELQAARHALINVLRVELQQPSLQGDSGAKLLKEQVSVHVDETRREQATKGGA